MISVQVLVVSIAGIKIPSFALLACASSAKFAESALAPAAHYTPARSAKYNTGFAARKGLLSSSNPIGHFSFNIPLSHTFGV